MAKQNALQELTEARASEAPDAPQAAAPSRKELEKPVESPKEDPKAPRYGLAYPAGQGPLPRVVGQRARAPEGLKRFKIRCTNMGAVGAPRYILAANEAEARQHYLRVQRIDEQIRRLQESGQEKIEPPLLVVVALPD